MEEKKNEISPTKKEPNYGGIKAMPFILGNETCEKLGTIGTASNLLVYLTTVFNMRSITATNVLNIFNGTCNIGSLVGAFLCDTYLGRYTTIAIGSVASFLGMLAITFTAVFPNLHPHKCASHTDETNTSCPSPSPAQLTLLFLSFVLLVIGSSGIRPCNLAFGVDQFNPKTESGKRGGNSFFNWYYFTYTSGMMIALTVIVYVQSNMSWGIGLGLPAALMFMSCFFFFIGTKIYVKVMPEGSPLTSLVQTLVVAFKKRELEVPKHLWDSLFNHIPNDSINSKLAYTPQLRFLDKAAMKTPKDAVNPDGSAANPWKLRTLQQVEETKSVLRVFPIWISGIIYYVVLVQLQNYVVFQALQTDRTLFSNFKLPAATYNVFTFLALTVWIPIYDRLLIPFIRRLTGKDAGITILQRVGIGIVFGILTMFVSGLVEYRRRVLALTRPTLGFVVRRGAISSMSGNWLIPPLLLGGLSEGFAIIGLIEFFYKEFPENMRSLGPSVYLCGCAISSYLSSFIASEVHRNSRVGEGSDWLSEDLNKGRLDWFYYLIGGIEIVNLGYFVACAKWYKYRKSDDGEK